MNKHKKEKAYEFVIIGAGSAGFNAARLARSLGSSVAMVDGARELGGLCILRGCMPSKTLLWSTDVLHLMQKSREFALGCDNAHIDMAALHERKRRIIGEFAGYRQKVMRSSDFDFFNEDARFLDSHRVMLSSGQVLRGRYFLIATGSVVSWPAVPGLERAHTWTSDEVLELSEAPESIIVLGGGVVASELSQFLARIGSKVVQIQRSKHILRSYSADAAAAVEEAFRADGIELHTDTTLKSIRFDGKHHEVTFVSNGDGRVHKRKAVRLLNALGRQPNTKGLCTEAAKIRLNDKGGIRTNRWQQCSQSHIYAAGDVCGGQDVVHVAIAQAEAAVRHALGIKPLRPAGSIPQVSIAYTSPPAASAGAREHDLARKGVPFIKASYPFNDHGKSIIMDEMIGFVSVLAAPKTGKVLGAEIVGPSAGELIHCFTLAISMGATVTDMLKAPWFHPTLAEIVTYPLEEIAEQLHRKKTSVKG